VKTAVSIPNDLFERAEALARKRGVSRSELYAHALRQLILRQTESSVTASFDVAYASADDEVDMWGDLREFRQAARRRRGDQARRSR